MHCLEWTENGLLLSDEIAVNTTTVLARESKARFAPELRKLS